MYNTDKLSSTPTRKQKKGGGAGFFLAMLKSGKGVGTNSFEVVLHCFSHTKGGYNKFSPFKKKKGGGGRFYPGFKGEGGKKFQTLDFPIL